jgi:polysaccharide export outer membrane protein
MKTVLKALAVLWMLQLAACSATNVPVAQTSTSQDDVYTIYPGDVLQVTVWKEEGLDREVVVLPNGTIDFPLIGSVSVKDQTPEDVQTAIKAKLKKFIPDASVSVVVKADLGHTINVIGQVTKPGELIMGHHLTVMQALSQAGGLTPYASQSKIIILRQQDGQEVSLPFPYSDVVSGDELDKDIVLKPGDVVVVPTAGLLW